MTYFQHTEIRPTTRELRWFAHIDRHGPQSSEFLYELTRNTHRCKDTALRRLQALREAGYLSLPPQQHQIIRAGFNPYVYDLTHAGFDALSLEHPLERHCRPSGHWWHGFWVASVSSAIEIDVTRRGCEYIPAARILAIKDAQMAIPLRRGSLIPDQLFAIKSPDGYRAYALEVDRGSEPVRSNAARKSLRRSVEQYREVLDGRLHQHHYGLKSNLIVIWVFASPARAARFRELRAVESKALLCASCSVLFPWFEVVQAVVGDVMSA